MLWVCFQKIIFTFLQWDLYTVSHTFINLSIYTKLSFFVFLKKVYPGLLVFLKSHYQTILENFFWFFYIWLVLLCQWPPLVSEWSWISIIHIIKFFILWKINFNQSFFITTNGIVFERTKFYLLMNPSFYSGNFSCTVN